MKFSIITPVYNGEKYIAETIESVLSQEGDFEIEYIIADGASTDRTIEIIKSYEQRLRLGQYPTRCKKITFQWFSEKDRGMYDAVEKGFARATGDVFAYINSDDKYLLGAFATVITVLSAYPEIEWVKGINTTGDENGNSISQGECFVYRQEWIAKGIYGRSAYFIQQDSVFWKSSLWDKARSTISSFRLAGDYALWVTFAKHAPLWSFNKQVSMFRKRPGQLSANMTEYNQEQAVIAPHNFFLEKRVILYFVLERFFRLDPKGLTSRTLFFIIFPFCKQEWYIDFDPKGSPTKNKAVSYLV